MTVSSSTRAPNNNGNDHLFLSRLDFLELNGHVDPLVYGPASPPQLTTLCLELDEVFPELENISFPKLDFLNLTLSDGATTIPALNTPGVDTLELEYDGVDPIPADYFDRVAHRDEKLKDLSIHQRSRALPPVDIEITHSGIDIRV